MCNDNKEDDYSPFPKDVFPEDVFPEEAFPQDVFPRPGESEDDDNS
jgi:hypothetical protein